MLLQFVTKYRTEDDLQEVAALKEQITAAEEKSNEALHEMQTDPKDRKLIAAYRSTYREVMRLRQEIENVYRRAEARYYDHFGTMYEDPEERRAAILGDLEKKLDALDDKDREAFNKTLDEKRQFYTRVQATSDDPDDQAASKLLKTEIEKSPRYWYAVDYCRFITVFQVEALRVHSLYDEKTARTIAERVADLARRWDLDVPEVLTLEEVYIDRLHGPFFYIPYGRDAIQRAVESEDAGARPVIKAVDVDIIEYPLDKIDRTLWRLSEEDISGQLRFAMERQGSKQEINALVSINFDALDAAGVNFTRQLTQFDKRVYIAAGAIFNSPQSGDITTARQIYFAMGNQKDAKPNQKDIEKINNSITKLAGTHLKLDSTEETRAGYHYPQFKYDAALLPMERITKLNVNGKPVDAAIHMFREPPLLTFAKLRNQVTTINRALLEVGLSNTESKLAIEDYLIERISWSDGSNTILLKTLFEETHITDKKQQARAIDKIGPLLDHYKAVGFIEDYGIEKDRVNIQKTKQDPWPKGKRYQAIVKERLKKTKK